VRGNFGVLSVVATSLMFITWAALTMSLYSRPLSEDFLYNRIFMAYTGLQAYNNALSDCLAYSAARSLDDAPDHNISSVTQNDIRGYFDSCMDEFASRLASAGSDYNVLFTFSDVPKPTCLGSCDHVKLYGTYRYSIAIDGVFNGLSISWKKDNQVAPVNKEMNVVFTGAYRTTDGRPVYRITVADRLLDRTEVNGLWPYWHGG